MKKLLLVILISLFSGVLFSPSVSMAQTVQTCPTNTSDVSTPDSYEYTNSANKEGKIAAYSAGYIFGCPVGVVGQGYNLDNLTCNNNPNEDVAYPGNWFAGCKAGVNAGLAIQTQQSVADNAILQQNLASWPPPEPDAQVICQGLGGYTSLGESVRAAFLNECIRTYHEAINNQRKATEAGVQQDFDILANDHNCTDRHGSSATPGKNGCLAGYGKAVDDFENSFPMLTAPTASEVDRFENNTEIARCDPQGSELVGNQEVRDGFQKGCLDGFSAGKSSLPNPCAAGASNQSGFDWRSNKHRSYNQSYKVACERGYVKGQAAEPYRAVIDGGIVPVCDPSLPPGGPDRDDGVPACGIDSFVQLIKNIMRYLWYIAIPIGVLMLGWGGFNIMTAAGSEERISTGRNAIKITVIGYIIMLAGYLIIQTIFTVLGVTSSFTSSLF